MIAETGCTIQYQVENWWEKSLIVFTYTGVKGQWKTPQAGFFRTHMVLRSLGRSSLALLSLPPDMPHHYSKLRC